MKNYLLLFIIPHEWKFNHLKKGRVTSKITIKKLNFCIKVIEFSKKLAENYKK